MKKKWNKRAIVIGVLAATAFSSLLSTGIATAVFAELSINMNSSFTYTYTDSGHEITLRCYPATGADAGSNAVAIAWGTDDPTDTPASFVVPSTFTHEGTLYTVKAIAESGFRYCDFETINLPDTIIEMSPESFYCCTSMTEFVIPKLVTKIAPSTFMDCRALTKVSYRDDNGDTTKTNSRITTIGDHAFTSCVSLRSFECPTSLIDTEDGSGNLVPAIGDAAFQNCKKLMCFFFPSQVVVSDAITNPITIGDYAFSDCGVMSLCYFQENVVGCGQYAFAECTKLSLYYTGASEPTHASNANFHEYWRKRVVTSSAMDVNDTNYVPINVAQGQLRPAPDYPGLYFAVTENARIYLDGKTDRNVAIDDAASTFATIIRFDTPEEEVEGYWETIDGKKTLTIPETVTDASGTYPLKVVGVSAFEGNTDIQSIIFSENLVQICHQGFYACPAIKALDFTKCVNLREVSYNVFQDSRDVSSPNTGLTSLHLPKCLRYVGSHAFYDFRNVTSFSFNAQGTGNPELQFIGRYAFGNLGANKKSGTVDLVLPKSLNDQVVTDVLHPYKDGSSEDNRAVMKGAFDGAKCLRKVTMEHVDTYTAKAENITLSVEVFQNCTNLVHFMGSKRLYRLGGNIFKNCSSLKEIFLNAGLQGTDDFAAPTASWNGATKPWGVQENNNNFSKLFDGTSYADLIIYVDAAKAPKDNDKPATTLWNSETATFKNEFPSTTVPLNRPTIPVYYGVDWPNNENAVRYLEIGTTNVLTSTNYDKNVIAFITRNNKHLITRCYCKDNKVTDIDLTGYPVSDDITVIGAGSFGQVTNGKIPGENIILPSTITTIGERAFYRQNNSNPNNSGVKKITYKSGGSLVTIGDRTEYCALPPSVTRIERLAFYNNRFTAVSLPTGLNFLGNTAFAVFPRTKSATPNDPNLDSRATIDTLNLGTNSHFSVINNGVYYTGEANHKTLLYQAAVGTNTTLTDGVFEVDADTKAIGVHALANTNYTKIKIPDSVVQLYGGALQRNGALTEVTFGDSPSLQYISGKPWNGDDEIYNGTYFDILDSTADIDADKNEYATAFGVFHQCTSMTTMDLTKLTGLKKVGYGAFERCTNLEYLIGSKKYTYYTYNSSGVRAVKAANRSNGILDLSACANLRSLGRYCFGDCTKLEYFHLPVTAVGSDGYHILHCATDPDSPGSVKQGAGGYSIFTGTTAKGNVLVGETASTSASSFIKDATIKANATKRYPATCFKGDNVYYHVTSASDIIYKSGTTPENGIRYWTEITPEDGADRSFMLFNDGQAVKKYYGV